MRDWGVPWDQKVKPTNRCERLSKLTGGIDKTKLDQKQFVDLSTITTFNPNPTFMNRFDNDICLFAVNIIPEIS